MRALTLAAAVVVLTSTAAVAQQSMMGQDSMGGSMMPMMGMMDPSQHIEGRLAFLKTELKITDAQAQQWNVYAEAVRANAKRMSELMSQMMGRGMMGHGTGQGMMGQGMMGQGMMGQGMAMNSQAGTMMHLPDRFDRMEQHLAAHMEMLQAIKKPTLQLYGVLSDEQKTTADQLLGPMGMMGMM